MHKKNHIHIYLFRFSFCATLIFPAQSMFLDSCGVKNVFKTKCFKKIFFLQANDLEETIKRIQTHKGVLGMMIVNNDGKYL